MSFSDEDLKRLKEAISVGRVEQMVSCDELKALLARLEAAEKVCLELALMNVKCNHKPERWDVVEDAFNAWRKSAGK